jgi:hypothetical protein
MSAMRKRFPLKILDIAVILLALGMTGFSVFAVYLKPGGAARVVISGSVREWIFPLDADERVDVSGPLGNTVVRIRRRQAWVESSPCANQLCVSSGRISGHGVWAACLPNNVFLRIEGSNDVKDAPDAAAW